MATPGLHVVIPVEGAMRIEWVGIGRDDPRTVDWIRSQPDEVLALVEFAAALVRNRDDSDLAVTLRSFLGIVRAYVAVDGKWPGVS